MNIDSLRPDTLERMVRAVERVKEQLAKATTALEAGGVPYAVIGGNAVAAWVAQVDEGAVRTTRDVDILVRRDDLPAVRAALENVGFVGDELLDVVMFRLAVAANVQYVEIRCAKGVIHFVRVGFDLPCLDAPVLEHFGKQ